jgi:hypothetical protein
LWVSACRGGLCVFDLSSERPVPTARKAASCVLAAFGARPGVIARIENGPSIALYEAASLRLLDQRSFPGEAVTHAFAFEGSLLVVCVIGRLLCYSDALADEVGVPLPGEHARGQILSHAVVNSTTVWLLSSDSVLFQFEAGGSVTFIRRFPTLCRRLFSIDSDYVFLTAIGGEVSFAPLHAKPVRAPIAPTGLTSLYVGSPMPGIAPHALSHIGTSLAFIREGIASLTFATQELPEPVLSVHAFSWMGKHYVALTHPTSTRFLEIFETELRQCDAPALMRESSQTIGVAVIRGTKEPYVFQVLQDGFAISSSSSKDYPVTSPISYCAFTSRQLILSFAHRTLRLYVVTDGNQIDRSAGFEVGASVTALCLSMGDPVTGMAELFAFGASDGATTQIFSLRVHVFSTDQTSRVQVLSEKMPCRVTGVEFLDKTRVCVGLENGCIVIGAVDRSLHRLESVMICHFGVGPCTLCKHCTGETALILAMSSRAAIITISRKMPRIRPIATNSFTAAAFIRNTPKAVCFLAVIGNTVSLVRLSDANDKFALQTAATNHAAIVGFRLLEKTEFVFVAVRDAVLIYNLVKPPAFDVLEKFDRETVTSIDINSGQTSCYLAVATRTDSGEAIIRLREIDMSTGTVRVEAPIFGHTCHTVTVVRVVVLGTSGNVVAGGDDKIMFFREVHGQLQICAVMGGLGVSIRHIVYTAVHSTPGHGVLYVGDSARSVKLLRYVEDTKSFQLFCEDGFLRSITALAPYSDSAVCGGDQLGNVFVFEYASILLTASARLDKSVFAANRRLTLTLNYNVGDVVTGVSFTNSVFPALWYTTISGEFGGFLWLNLSGTDSEWNTEHKGRIRLMRMIELEVSNLLLQLTGADHIGFRHRHYPACNTIDMDVLELYEALSDDRRTRIAGIIHDFCQGNVLMKVFENVTPAIIDFEITRFTHYFLDWQKKPK